MTELSPSGKAAIEEVALRIATAVTRLDDRSKAGWQNARDRLATDFISPILESLVHKVTEDLEREWDADWARRYDDAVQPLQKRAHEYIVRAEAAEASARGLAEALRIARHALRGETGPLKVNGEEAVGIILPGYALVIIDAKLSEWEVVETQNTEGRARLLPRPGPRTAGPKPCGGKAPAR